MGTREPRPGDVGFYDAAYADRHGARLKRLFDRYFRTRVDGLEHVPHGPFLSVGNHNGSHLHHVPARRAPVQTITPCRMALRLAVC